MKELFSDLLKISGVEGVLFLSGQGQPKFSSWPSFAPVSWPDFIRALNDIREADLAFQTKRLYIRKIDPGWLLVWMEPFAPGARIRLSCDVLIPSLKKIS
jgi:hypothetical protein